MQIVSYESAKKYHGSTPVFFVKPEGGELEGVVENTLDGIKVNPTAYRDIAVQAETPGDVQIHYIFVNGAVYRLFVGKGYTDADRHVVKSVVRVGSIPEDKFPQLVPSIPGLSESQVNRGIRRALKSEQKH